MVNGKNVITQEGVKEVIKKANLSTENKKEIMKDIEDRAQKERTMKLSIKEGSFSSVMSGFGDSYISPYALSLNASASQVSFLSSFSGLLSPIAQIFGSKLMEKYPRKKLVVFSVFFHALMWIPIALLSLLMWKGLLVNSLPIILIIFYSIYGIFGALASPAWFSLLGDVVPESIRGRYFSKRNRICNSIALICTLGASFILDLAKTRGFILFAFSTLFLIASITRFISCYFFTKHYDPEFKLEKGYYFSFWQFIKKAPFNNFGKFTIYIGLMNFAVNVAGPLFTVYMLRDLKFSYLTFTVVNISATLVTLLLLPLCGRISDKYGNRQLLKLGTIIVPILPALWIFSKEPLYLILVPQLLSGVGWAAFNFATSNFIYDTVTPQRRGICVAYYNLVGGIGTFLGCAVGGILVQYLNISFMNVILFIFLISTVLRFIVALVMMPLIKEVRPVSNFDTHLIFRSLNMTRGIFDGLGTIRKKFSHHK